MVYAVFILLLILILMTSAQCQQAAENGFNQGSALSNQSKDDEAVMAFDEAVWLHSYIVPTWIDKGNALSDQGKYDEAIKLDPDNAMAWSNKDIALEALVDTTEANATLDQPKDVYWLFPATNSACNL